MTRQGIFELERAYRRREESKMESTGKRSKSWQRSDAWEEGVRFALEKMGVDYVIENGSLRIVG